MLPESGYDGRRQGTMRSLLELPRNLRSLVEELRGLNRHLENISAHLNEVPELVEILADIRKITAPLLGWRVVKKDPLDKFG